MVSEIFTGVIQAEARRDNPCDFRYWVAYNGRKIIIPRDDAQKLAEKITNRRLSPSPQSLTIIPHSQDRIFAKEVYNAINEKPVTGLYLSLTGGNIATTVTVEQPDTSPR